jgi:MFS transporter, SHS family, lactate transporter
MGDLRRDPPEGARQPILIVHLLFHSAIEFAFGFAASFTVLLALRAIYGIAIRAEWGVAPSVP